MKALIEVQSVKKHDHTKTALKGVTLRLWIQRRLACV